jgi:hypothetical protein
MRLKVTDKKAHDVLLVLLDDKTVQMPIELDTLEGWVDCYVPIVDTTLTNQHQVAMESLEELEFKIVRKFGKVDVKFKK